MQKQMLCAALALSLCCLNAAAQQATTNMGNLRIHTGGSVSLFGDFTNTASATLVNDGTLHAKAHLTNNQSGMATGTGTLHLNGTAAQTLGGSALFRTLNLNTNNGAGITLANNLSVSGAHVFSAGIITPGVSNHLAYEAGSSYTGSSNSRHVAGRVRKSGSTDFTFPVGNGTVERTVRLVSLSTSGAFEARYLSTTPNTSNLQSPIVDLDGAEYWAIDKVSGGSASVTLNWDHGKVAFPNWDVAKIRATRYDGARWVNESGTASGTTTATGTITSNGVSSFSLFTFGSIDYVLPLTLLRFKAKRINGYTQLHWQTANEQGMRHFGIERSDGGTRFYSIGQVAARNSGHAENYTGHDKTPINVAAYYRLRRVDEDGSETLSAVVRVSDETTRRITLLTNPVRNRLTLLTSLQAAGRFHYGIYTPDGKPVQQGTMHLQPNGPNTLLLQPNITPGIYFINLTDGRQPFSFTFEVR